MDIETARVQLSRENEVNEVGDAPLQAYEYITKLDLSLNRPGPLCTIQYVCCTLVVWRRVQFLSALFGLVNARASTRALLAVLVNARHELRWTPLHEIVGVAIVEKKWTALYVHKSERCSRQRKS